MATGQGTTWVVVADAHHARVLEVADAGLLPRMESTVNAPPPGPRRSPEHGWTHGGDDPRPEVWEEHFTRVVVKALERGEAENRFQHLVLVAPPKLLGLLRQGLSRGLADRLRNSVPKDWARVPDTELPELARPLVEIWPR